MTPKSYRILTLLNGRTLTENVDFYTEEELRALEIELESQGVEHVIQELLVE